MLGWKPGYRYRSYMPLDLSKDKKLGVSFKKAETVVKDLGLISERPAVYLVIDRSGSMKRYFKDGTVQAFAERVLALSAHFDDDGVIPMVFFDDTARPAADIAVTGYSGIIDKLHKKAGWMGTTNYVAAMQAIVTLHSQKYPPGTPAFVVFQTDGGPDSKTATTEYLRQVAGLPFFWAFTGFGDEKDIPPGEGARFDYLRGLDTMTGRIVDNAGFFAAGGDPNAVPDEVLYANLMGEFPQWLAAARAAGIVARN